METIWVVVILSPDCHIPKQKDCLMHLLQILGPGIIVIITIVLWIIHDAKIDAFQVSLFMYIYFGKDMLHTSNKRIVIII